MAGMVIATVLISFLVEISLVSCIGSDLKIPDTKTPASFTLEFSSDVGLYLMKVKLGSSAEEFAVTPDTGSDISWVSCSSCLDCPRYSYTGSQFMFFDPVNSSTASIVPCYANWCHQCNQNNQCSYSIPYLDGSSASGFFVNDSIQVGESKVPVIFGCSTHRGGDLSDSHEAVDGIFGFGNGNQSFVSQLSAIRGTRNVFSHCLSREGSGSLVIGEPVEPKIHYTPLVPSMPHYYVNLQTISVNGQVLPIGRSVFATSDNRGTVVDSGTTYSFLVAEAYVPLVNKINSAVSRWVTPTITLGKTCYDVEFNSTLYDLFPKISFGFEGGLSLKLKPQEYIQTFLGYLGDPTPCIGFVKSNVSLTIFGDLVLRDKVAVYDIDKQRFGLSGYYNCSQPINATLLPVAESTATPRAPLPISAAPPPPLPASTSSASPSPDIFFAMLYLCPWALLISHM